MTSHLRSALGTLGLIFAIIYWPIGESTAPTFFQLATHIAVALASGASLMPMDSLGLARPRVLAAGAAVAAVLCLISWTQLGGWPYALGAGAMALLAFANLSPVTSAEPRRTSAVAAIIVGAAAVGGALALVVLAMPS